MVAPYLFLIVAEILNASIKHEVAAGRIRGISLPSSEEQQIISQYVDDSSLTIAGDEGSVIQTIATLDEFSKASGLQINKEKSSAYWWDRRFASALFGHINFGGSG